MSGVSQAWSGPSTTEFIKRNMIVLSLDARLNLSVPGVRFWMSDSVGECLSCATHDTLVVWDGKNPGAGGVDFKKKILANVKE